MPPDFAAAFAILRLQSVIQFICVPVSAPERDSARGSEAAAAASDSSAAACIKTGTRFMVIDKKQAIHMHGY